MGVGWGENRIFERSALDTPTFLQETATRIALSDLDQSSFLSALSTDFGLNSLPSLLLEKFSVVICSS